MHLYSINILIYKLTTTLDNARIIGLDNARILQTLMQVSRVALYSQTRMYPAPASPGNWKDVYYIGQATWLYLNKRFTSFQKIDQRDIALLVILCKCSETMG